MQYSEDFSGMWVLRLWGIAYLLMALLAFRWPGLLIGGEKIRKTLEQAKTRKPFLIHRHINRFLEGIIFIVCSYLPRIFAGCFLSHIFWRSQQVKGCATGAIWDVLFLWNFNSIGSGRFQPRLFMKKGNFSGKQLTFFAIVIEYLLICKDNAEINQVKDPQREGSGESP